MQLLYIINTVGKRGKYVVRFIVKVQEVALIQAVLYLGSILGVGVLSPPKMGLKESY